jgi:ArsR family transcriptional regulator, arsenate/arsenite/antimonite-responsive transcriptional repressor
MRLKNLTLSFGAQVFKALSEEPRVRILHLLFKKNELSISDLEQILDFTQAKTSRHLTYLKNRGIVNTRQEDQWVFYSIKEEVMDMIRQIMDYLSKDSMLLNDLENYETLYSNRELAAYKKDLKKWQTR